MPQSRSSFENLDFSLLLSRAGVTPRGASYPQIKSPTTASNGAQPIDLAEAVKAVKPPSQRALGAALESLLGDLSRVLSLPLFVADGDGLLLAGSGDAPSMAASIAADVMRSLQKEKSFTAAQINALLLKVPPQEYLVFSRRENNRCFVMGALIVDNMPLKALQLATELIWETLFMRIQYA